jgi:PAS domain S-box-containing protein
MPESYLLEASLNRKAPHASRLAWLLPLLVLALGLAMTVMAWREAQLVSHQEIQRDFEYQVRRIANLLQQRMATYEQVLRGAQGFMRGRTGVDRGDFAGYIATLRLQESFPGIQGIAIAELIAPALRESRVAAVRAEGYPDFSVRPDGERPFYSAIVQIEPANRMNLRALGYDMLTEPARRAAMEQARDSGVAAISGKLTLIQEQGPQVQNGVIVYLPVYGRGLPVSTVAERRASLVAWVGAPFRMDDLMRGLLGERADDLRLQIFDGAGKSEQARLYDSAGADADAVPAPAMLDATRRFRIADREWTLAIGSTPLFDSRFDHSKPLFIASAGVGISLLLATLVWLLASGRSRALALAGSMTRALRASQLRWQYALEGAGDGVWDWNNHSGELVLSRRWKEMLGYPESELMVTLDTWADLIHPDDRAATEQALTEYVAGRTPAYSREMRMRCRDGSWKWILTRGAVVSRAADGRALRTIGTHTDISNLKENEEALRASYSRIAAEQRRIRVILENSHDAFIAVGPDGRITDWNTEAERTLGWPAREAIGQSLAGLIIPPAERAAYQASFAGFAASGGGDFTGRREIAALHRSGREIPVEIALAAVPHEAGFAATAFVRDISDRREAERMRAAHERSLEEARAALHHAQKLEAVGKLTGGIAHDFNNVLQIISGYLQLMQRDAGAGSLLRQQLQRALDAVDRGARLSSRLLAFARRQPLQPVAVNLGRLVDGMQELLRGALGESVSLTVTTAPEDALWNTLADRDQLQNVILNLAINARDAMDGAGSLAIALENVSLAAGSQRSRPDLPAGDYVLLSMQDSGAGMTPEVRERAFEPFFTTKAEGVGTGLGLSMAYGFIAQSGGHIDIGSAPGEGATVRIFLPRADLPEAAVTAPASEQATGGSEAILVVEDDEAVRASVCAMLEGLGYRVRSAGDAEQALRLLQDGAPADLLFTDVVMPGPLRAPELARQALALRPGLALLYTSGYTRDAVLHAAAGRAPMLLKKPYRREQLAQKIREALDSQGSPRQASGQRVLVVESHEDSRQIACDMLSLLGHAPRGVASVAEAGQALAAARFDTLLVADDVIDRDQALQMAQQRGLRLVLVGDAGTDEGAVDISKPYSMEKLRLATART